MKLAEILPMSMNENFRDEVETVLFDRWKEDPFFPLDVDNPYEMDDDDFQMFMGVVDEVIAFAKTQHIAKPEDAVDQHLELLVRKQGRPVYH